MSHPPIIYTHPHKGGRYLLLGVARPAGTKREDGHKPVILYQCTETGQLYYRSEYDFHKTMTPSS